MAAPLEPWRNNPPRALRRRWIAVGMIVVAAASAIAALFTPWYTDSNTTNHYPDENQSINISSTTTFYPGSTYRFYCSVAPATARVWGPICAVTHPDGLLQPYSGLVFPLGMHPATSSLGTLYGYVWWLSFFAGVVSIVALALFVVSLRRGSRGNSWVAAVAALAVAGVLAVGAGGGVALEQPPATAHDCQFGGVACTSASGFWGSCGPSPASCGVPSSGNLTETTEWGPTFGWYLEALAGLLLLGLAASTIIAQLRRRRTTSGQPPAH